MKILGIETSCDETAAAIVEDGWNVHSNVIASSLDLHKETGGIVPEVAARDSALKIVDVVKHAIEACHWHVSSGNPWDHIDAIAVTNGPGLLGSLLVGIEAAKTLSMLHEKPLIPVFHIAGHLFSNILEREEPLEFPIISLTVAGGHNDLYLWNEEEGGRRKKEVGNKEQNFLRRELYRFKKLGGTIDDAAGEAFDKGARMLGLSYPGGPALSKLAETGDSRAYDFPRPMMGSGDYDFSFSGLKTALFYEIRNQKLRGKSVEREEGRRKEEEGKNKNTDFLLPTSYSLLPDIAASYQEAIVDTLIAKLFQAVDEFGAKEVHLAGGVSANTRLREKFSQEAEKRNLKTRIPVKMEYCTDNAAMIAAAGYGMRRNTPRRVPTAEQFSFQNVAVNLGHEFRF